MKNFKKLISLMLVIASLCVMPFTFADNELISENADGKIPFVDVVGQWYEAPVSYMYELGFVKGKEADKFCPEDNVTRGELALILYRIVNNASDIEIDEVGNWALSNGIMEWFTSENEFESDVPLLREEVVTMLNNTASLYKDEVISENLISKFKDASDIAIFGEVPFNWAIKKGIVKGDDENRLNPKQLVTRAEACAMLQRFIESGITKKQTSASIANPMHEFNTLEEAENAAEIKFPEIIIEEFTAKKYIAIIPANKENNILEVVGEYDNKKVTIRVSKGINENSGIYGGVAADDAPLGIKCAFYKFADIAFAEWSKNTDGADTSYSVAIEGGTTKDVHKFVAAIGVDPLVPLQ